LNYYYKDVVIAPVKDNYLLRVNIGHQLNSVSISTQSKSGILRLIPGESQGADTSTGSRNFPAKVNLTFGISGLNIMSKATYANGRVINLPVGQTWTIRWSGTRDLEGQDAVTSVSVNGVTTKYRHGQIQIRSVKTPTDGYRMEVTNTVRLHDEYLWGIGEMPSSWPRLHYKLKALHLVAMRSTKLVSTTPHVTVIFTRLLATKVSSGMQKK
ncbi:MAG: hypothetical protein NTY21_02050, partial [Actinobacteria bacterium]|nr:hypothetical protein [Actinomycetota bacterium]